MSRFDRRMRGLRPGESTKSRRTNIPTQNFSEARSAARPTPIQQSPIQTQQVQDGLASLAMSEDKNTRIMSSHEIRLNEIDEKLNDITHRASISESKYDNIMSNFENHIKTLFGNINKFNTIIEGFRRFEGIVNETTAKCNSLEKRLEKVNMVERELMDIKTNMNMLKMELDVLKGANSLPSSNLDDTTEELTIDKDVLLKKLNKDLGSTYIDNQEGEKETVNVEENTDETLEQTDENTENDDNTDEEVVETKPKDNIQVEIIETSENDTETELEDIRKLVSSTLEKKMTPPAEVEISE